MPTSARQNAPFFTEIRGEFVTSQRVDVGIDPYKQVGKCCTDSPIGFCFSRLPAATSQVLRASVPTLFGPSGHFPLTGGIDP